MDDAAQVMPVIGKDISLAGISFVQGLSCFRAELSIEIAFLNSETGSQAHECGAEKPTNESGDEDDQQMTTDDAEGLHLSLPTPLQP